MKSIKHDTYVRALVQLQSDMRKTE